MATRCQIVFQDEERPTKKTKLSEPHCIIYRHWDGYPDGVLPDIMPILEDFDKDRGLGDIEYASAWLVAKLKVDLLNIGISKNYHLDIEYIYEIFTGGEIRVWSVNMGDWWGRKTDDTKNEVKIDDYVTLEKTVKIKKKKVDNASVMIVSS
jgi:hypothetical protein